MKTQNQSMDNTRLNQNKGVYLWNRTVGEYVELVCLEEFSIIEEQTK